MNLARLLMKTVLKLALILSFCTFGSNLLGMNEKAQKRAAIILQQKSQVVQQKSMDAVSDNEDIVKKLLYELEHDNSDGDDFDYSQVERRCERNVQSLLKVASPTTILRHINKRHFDFDKNLDDNIVIYLIPKLIKADPKAALSVLLKFIDQENIKRFSIIEHVISELLKIDVKTVVPFVLKLISRDAMQDAMKDTSRYLFTLIARLLHAEPHTVAPLVLKCIHENNSYNESITKEIVPALRKLNPAELLQYITCDTIADDLIARDVAPMLLQADSRAVAPVVLSLINENNITHPNIFTYIIPALLKADPIISVPVILRSITQENIGQLGIDDVMNSLLDKNPEKALPVALKCITENNITYRSIAVNVIPKLLQINSKAVVPVLLNLMNQKNIQDGYVNGVIALLLKEDPELVTPVMLGLITQDNINSVCITGLLIPRLLEIDSHATLSVVLKCITKDNINGMFIAQDLIPFLLKMDSYKIDSYSIISRIIECITLDNITDKFVRENVVPALLKINPDVGKIIGEKLRMGSIDDHSRLDMYLYHPKKFTNYEKILSTPDLMGLLEIKIDKNTTNNTIKKEPSYQSFDVNSSKIIKKFNPKLENELYNRLSIYAILKREKEIIARGNYPIAHGRTIKFGRFVVDNVFLYLLDIFYGKDIDKKSHYTQHYAFPGETWQDLKSDNPFYEFIGLPINLPENKVADIVYNGILSSKSLSYERSTLQFGSNILGAKGGSSALDYVLRNENVDEKRGSVTIEDLFNRLGKALGKDVSAYYKKYEHIFEQLCEVSQKFHYGTMLVYEFTPQALQKYVLVTHSSGGHINENGSGIKIKGMFVRTNNPKMVLDTLIHNPKDFDEPKRGYEYFWPLTDEGTANPFNDDIKTYSFHIGKHDENLAKNITYIIARVFERIKREMAQDGIITYQPQSRL